MIVIDTSAWIEYLRDGRQSVADAVEVLLDAGQAAVTEPVIMEVLQGARSELHSQQLIGLLSRASLVPVEGRDFSQAALLYRLCRANGDTVRSSIDCLVASAAIRTGLPVLHSDRDFAVLGRHTPLVERRG